jgi:pSer/pThr/pTyr-binding forkhead associated (FHA) protein
MIYLKEKASGKEWSIKKELLKIGRSSDAEIQLKAVSISRHHATLYMQANGLIVEDAGSQNGVRVNGKGIAVATSLKIGDVIELGGVELEVCDSNHVPKMKLEAQAPPVVETRQRSSSRPRDEEPEEKSRRPLFIAIAVIVVVLGVFLLPDEEASRLPAGGAVPLEAPLSQDEITKALNSDAYGKKGYTTRSPTEVEAESRYRQAMRDYYDGNYSRAIVVLKQALVANPSHSEAREYLQFAERRLENQIDLLLKSGQRSYAVLQYSRARSEFSQVLSILSEQIPGYWQRVSSDLNAPDADRRPAQEEVLLKVPCEKTRKKEACNLSVEMIKLCRKLLREEDVLK